MRDDPIFVLSQPRAGSTLVQRLLNLCPGVTIMGEHGGPFHKIAYAYLRFEAILRKGEYYMDMDAEDLSKALRLRDNFMVATLGGVRIDDIREITRQYIRAVGNPLRDENARWGFKEVVTPDVGATVAKLFPKSQIICLVRDPVDCINSVVRAGWWGRDIDWIIRDIWKQKFDDFRTLVYDFPNQVKLVRYEGLSESMPEIFKWLGLEWTADHKAMLDGEHVGTADKINRDTPLLPDEIVKVREACKDYYVT